MRLKYSTILKMITVMRLLLSLVVSWSRRALADLNHRGSWVTAQDADARLILKMMVETDFASTVLWITTKGARKYVNSDHTGRLRLS